MDSELMKRAMACYHTVPGSQKFLHNRRKEMKRGYRRKKGKNKKLISTLPVESDPYRYEITRHQSPKHQEQFRDFPGICRICVLVHIYTYSKNLFLKGERGEEDRKERRNIKN